MQDNGGKSRIRTLEASDERQYMMNEKYEVYEKNGAPLGAVSYHYHSFYEVIYVLEGEYSSVVENRTYDLHKGDFLLIDVNVMHRYNYDAKKQDTSKRIILWISQAMLDELSGDKVDLGGCFSRHEACLRHFPIYYEELLRGYLLKLAMTGGTENERPEMKSVMDKGYLSLLFYYLNVLSDNREYLLSADEGTEHEMIERINTYIDEHITEQITVDTLAGQVHMSKYYFLRKFKELTGLTAHAYIIQKRLLLACQELRRGESINQVVLNCGFADYSSFLRNFKEKFGISPKKYINDYAFEP